jgi:two-component system chemotaxis response regulator CheY
LLVKRKVLVVDDEHLFRELLSEFLDALGYQVFQAEDGVEAVEAFERERPHITFLDIRMPRKDGIEALQEIKDIDPEALVVVITASPKEGVKDKALAQGVFDYINKPITLQRLESILERIRQAEGSEKLQE